MNLYVSAVERRGQLARFDRLWSESQGQDLAVTVLHVLYSLDSGPKRQATQGYLAHKKVPPPLGPP